MGQMLGEIHYHVTHLTYVSMVALQDSYFFKVTQEISDGTDIPTQVFRNPNIPLIEI